MIEVHKILTDKNFFTKLAHITGMGPPMKLVRDSLEELK